MKLLRSCCCLLALALAPLLPTAEPPDPSKAIDALMSRYFDYGQFNGTVLVAAAGEPIYRKGFGLANMEWEIPNTPDTRFRLGSITKQFTAALILQLVSEGKVELDAPLSRYVPEYPAETGDRVTVHQLLTHTSGIKSYTSLPRFWKDLTRDAFKPLAFLSVFSAEKPDFSPGERFLYNNSGYFLLGVIIEKVAGKSYETALEERIFKPLGMSGSGYDRHEKLITKRAGAYTQTLDGYVHDQWIDMSTPYAAGALYSTVEDLYRWDQALYGDEVLSAEMKKLMFTEHAQPPGSKVGYGYGWLIEEADQPGESDEPLEIIGHGGGIPGFSTLIQRIPADRHLVVLLNNTGGTKLGEMATKIREILYGQRPEDPKRPAAPEIYDAYQEGGSAAAIARFRQLRDADGETDDLDPQQLRRVGAHLLTSGHAEDAIAVMTFHTAEFPRDAEAQVLLGDAQLAAGKKDDAAASYGRALTLAPGRADAIAAKLREITGEKAP